MVVAPLKMLRSVAFLMLQSNFKLQVHVTVISWPAVHKTCQGVCQVQEWVNKQVCSVTMHANGSTSGSRSTVTLFTCTITQWKYKQLSLPPNFTLMGTHPNTLQYVVSSRDDSATQVLIPHITVTMLSPGGGPYVSFILFSTLALRFLWTSIEVVREEKFTFSNICNKFKE